MEPITSVRPTERINSPPKLATVTNVAAVTKPFFSASFPMSFTASA